MQEPEFERVVSAKASLAAAAASRAYSFFFRNCSPLHKSMYVFSAPIMNLETFKVAALAGDGIGPEVMREAIKVLRAVERKCRVRFDITEAPMD